MEPFQSQQSHEFELVCKYSKKINDQTLRFPYPPTPGDKVVVEGKKMVITARIWDHTEEPAVMRLEVHLDH